MKSLRRLSLVFPVLVALSLLQGCPKTTPSPAAYQGQWQGADGTYLRISADGHGDFKMGSKKVSGGAATVDENAKTLEVKLFGISQKWTIDEPPHDNGGNTEMKLSGMVFRRTAGFNPNESGGDSGKSQIPAEAELQKLTANTLLDFDAAVKAKDFTKFHANIAKVWQEQVTPAKLKEIFGVFIEKEATISGAVKNLKPVFTPAPHIDDQGLLVLEGYYPSKPMRILFELKYIQEEDQWKLVSINVNMKAAPGANKNGGN